MLFEGLDDGARTEGATVGARLEMLGPTLRDVLGVLGREDTDDLGATVTLGLLRLGVLIGLETAGGRAERVLKLLLGPRLLEIEGLDGRLTLGGALILGAGAGLGAERTAARLPPELDSFFSFAAEMGW